MKYQVRMTKTHNILLATDDLKAAQCVVRKRADTYLQYTAEATKEFEKENGNVSVK